MDLTEHNNKPHFRSTSSSSTTTAASSSTTNELFVCFTSRLSSLSSSSSMKLTKSILSPARAARDVAGASLSSSLSRRLRTNGSLKGGASPFFTTTANNKRRGGGGGTGFENPEPSSPKVTCIGQVRVKTKKKKKKKVMQQQQQQSRSLSRRRSSGGGEVSFRKIEHSQNDEKETRFCNNGSAHYQNQQPECLPHRNQRWVHLPVSICEALRAFGAEFSCLFPCSKSSCFSSGGERGEKSGEKVNGSCENGCGAVFARWLVSVNDGEGGKRREIELVVGGGDDEVVDVEEIEEKRVSMRRSSRRHVFEDIEVKDDRIEVKGQSCGGEGGEEESGRVSVCVPPKNALLLMRCRSDPMKMADLASRFSWDAHAGVASNNESGVIEEEGTSGGDGIEEFERECGMKESKDEIFMVKEDEVMNGVVEQDVGVTNTVESSKEHEIQVEENVEMGDEIHEEELVTHSEEAIEDKGEEDLQSEIEVNEESLVVEEEEGKEEEEEVESNMSSFEDLLNQESTIQHYEDCPIQENELGEEEEQDSPICHLSPSTTESGSVATTESSTTEIPLLLDESPFEKQQQDEETIPEDFEKTLQEFDKEEQQQQQQDFGIKNAEPPKKQLPDCLLLMMCEPKLSMEVSKETWVCTTDFVKWLPQRPPKQPPKPAKTDNNNNHNPPLVIKRRLSIDSKPKQHIHDNNNVKEHHQPPRSSCSLPAAVLEKKLVNAVAYEPFVLTRCKSEPMRTAAAKLMPESCVWKNAVRKMEPHRRATVGVGPA